MVDKGLFGGGQGLQAVGRVCTTRRLYELLPSESF